MTKQKQLEELYLKNQIRIEQLKSSQIEEWKAFLKKLDRELRKTLSGNNLTDFKRQRLEQQLKKINALIKAVQSDFYIQLKKNLEEIAEIEATQTASALNSVGFGDSVPTTAQLMSAAITEPLVVEGITGGSLLDNFVKDWNATERKRIIHALRKGYALGQTNQEILQVIRGTKAKGYRDGILAQTDRHTKTLIRTAVAHVASTTARETEKQLGVEKHKWSSTLDSRTTPICRCLDGEIFDIDKPPFTPAHLNCRSRRVPYNKKLDKIFSKGKTRSSEFGYVDGKITYYEWLKQQSKEYQDGVLGKARGEIFRSKGMTVAKFKRLQLNKHFQQRTVKDIKRELFTERSKAKLILVDKNIVRDEKEIKRLLNGANDPKRISEVNTAVDYQKAKKVTLNSEPIRYDETKQPIKGADFVIKENGKTIDAMYSAEGYSDYRRAKFNQYLADTPERWENTKAQINNHFDKADIVLMDMRLLTRENKDKILGYVLELPKEKQKRIQIIESK
ncbi:MAG: minor capsid protein [Gammaproteobacteria bacterium]|nr:minor capsid protein [Gammaproteobacteria bacterium]